MTIKDKSRLRNSGVIELGENDLVKNLHEKPSRPLSPWFCPPFYCLLPSALEKVRSFLLAGNENDAPGHFIAYLAGMEKVFSMKVNSSRFDTGAMHGYKIANKILAKESVIKNSGAEEKL